MFTGDRKKTGNGLASYFTVKSTDIFAVKWIIAGCVGGGGRRILLLTTVYATVKSNTVDSRYLDFGYLE